MVDFLKYMFTVMFSWWFAENFMFWWFLSGISTFETIFVLYFR